METPCGEDNKHCGYLNTRGWGASPSARRPRRWKYPPGVNRVLGRGATVVIGLVVPVPATANAAATPMTAYVTHNGSALAARILGETSDDRTRFVGAQPFKAGAVACLAGWPVVDCWHEPRQVGCCVQRATRD